MLTGLQSNWLLSGLCTPSLSRVHFQHIQGLWETKASYIYHPTANIFTTEICSDASAYSADFSCSINQWYTDGSKQARILPRLPFQIGVDSLLHCTRDIWSLINAVRIKVTYGEHTIVWILKKSSSYQKCFPLWKHSGMKLYVSD